MCYPFFIVLFLFDTMKEVFMDISALCSLTAALKENISKVIMGKEEQIEKILLC